MAPLASIVPLAAQEEMVTVLVPENPAEQRLAEAALEEAGIAFLVKNSDIQSLYGTGEIGLHNPIGSIEIQVVGREAGRAGRLLSEALTPAVPEARDEREAALEAQFRRYSTYSLVWGLLWLGGVGSLLATYFGLKALGLRREVPALSKARPVFGLILGLLGLVSVFLEWGQPLFR
ncbi:MAG TPA: DUF2007 domain-containing protein [Thermoanaerobaculia bacterium]|jgi:hypothetical protein|nr:DUF2007 domain-containing protein [Thermoanaerobaculia bacterium]